MGHPLITRAADSSASDPTADLTPEQRQWVDDAVAAFALTDDEVQQLSDDIYSARITSYSAAYDDAASIANADIATDGSSSVPDAQAAHEQRHLANANASGIAETYKRDVERAAAGVVALMGAAEITGTAVAQGVSQALQQRATWKPGQIANSEAGSGADAGTFDALDDLSDGVLLDASGNPIDMSEYVVAILPDGAAEPFCADFAGNAYSIDDYDSLDGIFPAHPNCPHYAVVIPYYSSTGRDEFV